MQMTPNIPKTEFYNIKGMYNEFAAETNDTMMTSLLLMCENIFF